MKHRPFLIVISAASGTGKTTVIRRVLERSPELVYSVSATTRPKRPNEVDGKSYHFLSREEFERKIREGYFVEWAEIYGDYYGTPKPFLVESLRAGKEVILDLDVHGKRALERQFPGQVVSVFLIPPDLETLKARLMERRADPPEKLKIRLELARTEIQNAHEYQYIVVNDEVEAAVQRILTIIEAERMRAPRVIHPLLPDLENSGSLE